MDLFSQSRPIPAFEIDGRYFVGNIIHLAENYIDENPSKKFIVWLLDKGITEIQL